MSTPTWTLNDVLARVREVRRKIYRTIATLPFYALSPLQPISGQGLVETGNIIADIPLTPPILGPFARFKIMDALGENIITDLPVRYDAVPPLRFTLDDVVDSIVRRAVDVQNRAGVSVVVILPNLNQRYSVELIPYGRDTGVGVWPVDYVVEFIHPSENPPEVTANNEYQLSFNTFRYYRLLGQVLVYIADGIICYKGTQGWTCGSGYWLQLHNCYSEDMVLNAFGRNVDAPAFTSSVLVTTSAFEIYSKVQLGLNPCPFQPPEEPGDTEPQTPPDQVPEAQTEPDQPGAIQPPTATCGDCAASCIQYDISAGTVTNNCGETVTIEFYTCGGVAGSGNECSSGTLAGTVTLQPGETAPVPDLTCARPAYCTYAVVTGQTVSFTCLLYCIS